MAQSYVPDAGDRVWLSFDPQTGHGQARFWQIHRYDPFALGSTGLNTIRALPL